MRPGKMGMVGILGVIFLSLSSMVFGRAGDPDTAFGINGAVSENTGEKEGVKALAGQADGKVIAGIDSESQGIKNGMLARYGATGALDASFGAGGMVHDLGLDAVDALLILADGSILAGGTKNGLIIVVCLNSDGTLKDTFGSNGSTTLDFGQGVSPDKVHKLISIENNKLFAIASSGTKVLLAQLGEDGILDLGYDMDGLKTVDLALGQGKIAAIQRLGDGGLVVAGYLGSGACLDANFDPNDPATYTVYFVSKIDMNGNMDAGFGQNGLIKGQKVDALNDSCSQVKDILVNETSGKLLVGGTEYFESSVYPGEYFYSGRLWQFSASSGAPDLGFGVLLDGKVSLDTFDAVERMAKQKDGKIIVMGNSSMFVVPSKGTVVRLGRVLANGKIDDKSNNSKTYFGDEDGTKMLWIGYTYDEYAALLLRGNGRILVGGKSSDDLLVFNSTMFQVKNDAVMINMTPASLKNGKVGKKYSATLKAKGGQAPYTFKVIAGKLPPGLSLSTKGVISGTPKGWKDKAKYKTSSFTIQAKDKNGETGKRAYKIKILK